MKDRRKELRTIATSYWKKQIPEVTMPSLNGPFFDTIRQIRHQSRVYNGGGGCCHLVTDWLYQELGFERLAVSVLMPDGSISIAGHYISLLPDGSIMDPTADQFCAGHNIRILKPQDKDYKHAQNTPRFSHGDGWLRADLTRQGLN